MVFKKQISFIGISVFVTAIILFAVFSGIMICFASVPADASDAVSDPVTAPNRSTVLEETINPNETGSTILVPGAPNWIVIGDSYCKRGKAGETLSDFLEEELQLTARNGSLQKKVMSGSGVARRKRSFIKMLKGIRSDRRVTDILFLGGIFNDRIFSRERILKSITSLARCARRKFPNARIMYGIGNWCKNPSFIKEASRKKFARRYCKDVIERIPWYREACKDNGIFFLSGVAGALRGKNNNRFFLRDGHHPNRVGRKKLAAAIAGSVRKLDRKTKVSKIVLYKKTLKLQPENQFRLKVKSVQPEKAVCKNVIFRSGDSSVCTVGKYSGIVRAEKKGVCTIYCLAADGSGTFAACVVKVGRTT